MWDAVLGVIKKGDGLDCPYKENCNYGKKLREPCPYYWLSKAKNVKPS